MSEPSLAGVEQAAETIRPFVPETPLVKAELLSKALGLELWLKNEGATATFSFKLRGATNDLLRAQARDALTGVVVSSTGNLGLGVSYIGRRLDVPAHVFVTTLVGPAKRAIIALHGGTVHRVGTVYEHAREAAMAFAAERGFHFVNDGESVDIMEGAATMALEVARRLPDVDYLVIPMGGGSLTSGSSAVMAALQPKAKTVAVSPATAPVMEASWRAGKPLSIPPGPSVADGLVQQECLAYTLAILRKYLADAWLVNDPEVLGSVHALLETAHVLVEPSGAASVAAVWNRRAELKSKRVVAVLTGANTTAEAVLRALDTPSIAPLS